LLEFVAREVLRIKKPNRPRPFRAGNLALAVWLGIGPATLIDTSRAEEVKPGHTSAMLFWLLVGLLGPLLWRLTVPPRARRVPAAEAVGD